MCESLRDNDSALPWILMMVQIVYRKLKKKLLPLYEPLRGKISKVKSAPFLASLYKMH